jgi:hypothetical protein
MFLMNVEHPPVRETAPSEDLDISGEEAYRRRMAMLHDIPSVPQLSDHETTTTTTGEEDL